MMETSVLSPSARLRSEPLSYDEYLSLADESRIIEWADGEVIFHTPPTPVLLADAPGLSDELRAAYRELLRLL